MPDLEKFVKNVMYGGIGAAASLVEKGGDLARSLVEKGQETVRNSHDTADDIKRRLQEDERLFAFACLRVPWNALFYWISNECGCSHFP